MTCWHVSTYWTKWPERASLQMGCSARVSQNSQASRATFSSGSWVRCSIYWWKTTRGDKEDEEWKAKIWLLKMLFQIKSRHHLDDAVHVWDKAVNANFQQHDKSPAHVLPHFTVLITSQRKQTLDRKETRWERGWVTERRNTQTGSTNMEGDKTREKVSNFQTCNLTYYVFLHLHRDMFKKKKRPWTGFPPRKLVSRVGKCCPPHCPITATGDAHWMWK